MRVLDHVDGRPSAAAGPVPSLPAASAVIVVVVAAALMAGGTSVVAMPQTAAQQPAPLQGTACTPAPYTGTICSSLINYPVGISAAAQAAAEANLQANIGQLSLLKTFPDCQNAILRLTCAALFPRCDAAGSVEIACEASCQAMYAVCTPHFQQAGLPVVILDSKFNNCSKNLSTDDPEPWGPPGKCLDYDSLGASAVNTNTTEQGNGTASVIPSNFNAACPSIFLPQTRDEANKSCKNGCCVPCPAIAYLYDEGFFDTVTSFQIYASLASALISGWVVLSWSVLPGRREHPSDIVLHFAIAICLWMSSNLIPVGNPKRIQCGDAVTPATAHNNVLCGIQGAWIMFGVHASVFWCSYMIANLHASIVWRSNIFERYKTVGVVTCWGLPVVLTAIPFLVSEINADTGVLCNIASKDANIYFFSVHTVLVTIAFVLSIFTSASIVAVTLQAIREAEESSRKSSSDPASNRSALSFEAQRSTRISARRRARLIIRSNWRAIMLSFIFIATYIGYVAYFNVVVLPFSQIDGNTSWIKEWETCMLTPGNTQNVCAAEFKDRVPSFAMYIIATLLITTPGMWLFIIFCFNRKLFWDWINLLSCGRRRGV